MQTLLSRPIGVCLFVLCLASACTPPDKQYTRAVCYWKISLEELIKSSAQLDSIGSKTVFLRYFDAEFATSSSPHPTARFDADTQTIKGFGRWYSIVPCVFLSDVASDSLGEAACDILAANIARRVLKMHRIEFRQKPARVLIDYDWTDRTREMYFRLLRRLQDAMPGVSVECSVRLWQFKKHQQNTPPVQRVLLMCYNMASPTIYSTDNSIADLERVKQFVDARTAASYPLNVDVALPAFSWAVAFSEGDFKGLLEGFTHSDFANRDDFLKNSKGMYTLQRDRKIGYQFFERGAEFRVDALSPAQVHELGAYVLDVLPTDNARTVALYSWKRDAQERFPIAAMNRMYP